MKIKLKSCPFCGNDEIHILKQMPLPVAAQDKPMSKWLVRCPVCCTYKIVIGSKNQCYVEWNTRQPSNLSKS